jgi:hypothetical protein
MGGRTTIYGVDVNVGGAEDVFEYVGKLGGVCVSRGLEGGLGCD